jgi:hypothetical protein
VSAVADQSAIIRLFRRLASRDARLVKTDGGWKIEPRSATDNRERSLSAEPALVDKLLARGLLAAAGGGAYRMTDSGRALLRRHLAGADGFAAQHQSRSTIVIDDGHGGRQTAVLNQDESPLAWLRRRKGRDGKPLIDAAEFAAGERLRSDYERGRIMPRVTANWTAAVADSRRDGSAGGIAELTEAAIAARQRVDRALIAVGPDFAGVLVDFCCFLKGIEEIERTRLWPARSAKLVIRLALASLARHYGLSPRAEGLAQSGRLRHWGAEDYRPRIE